MRDPVVREFLLTFWKIHILHHAAEEQGVYGQWMLEELGRHGYRLSPGTLYPLLARMARRGWIRAAETERSRDPRVYRITPEGSAVLTRLRGSLGELQHEVGRFVPVSRRGTSTAGAKATRHHRGGAPARPRK
jgi:PadR family transcriptional regulator, regulatory protein PadR